MPSRSRSNPLKKQSRRGFRGYPIATIAYYGPDDTRASKVAVCIIVDEAGDVADMKKWFSDSGDLRQDRSVILEISEYAREHHAASVVLADRILGCPHEEGIDYPEGEACPKCPFWRNRDRFTGEKIQ